MSAQTGGEPSPRMVRFQATNIDWETDGKRVRGLPRSAVVEVECYCMQSCECEDRVADELSDAYGWLIKGMEVRLISHGESWLGEVLTASGLAFS
jgi:hypothetical protein